MNKDIVDAVLSDLREPDPSLAFTGRVTAKEDEPIESPLELISEYANYRLVLTQPNYMVIGQMSAEGDVDIVDINTRGRGGFVDKITIEFLPGASERKDAELWFHRKIDAARDVGIEIVRIDEETLVAFVEDHGSTTMPLRAQGLYHLGLISVRPWDKGAFLIFVRLLANSTFDERMKAVVADFHKMERFTDYLEKSKDTMQLHFDASGCEGEEAPDADYDSDFDSEVTERFEHLSRVADRYVRRICLANQQLEDLYEQAAQYGHEARLDFDDVQASAVRIIAIVEYGHSRRDIVITSDARAYFVHRMLHDDGRPGSIGNGHVVDIGGELREGDPLSDWFCSILSAEDLREPMDEDELRLLDDDKTYILSEAFRKLSA